RSATFVPASAIFRISMICCSLNLAFFTSSSRLIANPDFEAIIGRDTGGQVKGYMPSLGSITGADSLFNDMLAKQVRFYRTTLPPYATVVHPGGAPDWLIKNWLTQPAGGAPVPNVIALIKADLPTVEPEGKSTDDLVRSLLDRFTEHP